MFKTCVKWRALTVLSIVVALCSCTSTRKSVYFNGIKDSDLNITAKEIEPVIKPNDILSIVVTSLNAEATEVFNKPILPETIYTTNTATTTQANGYLVSQEGYIQFPILGNIKVVNLTKKQIKDHLTQLLVDRKLLVDPVVDVRYLNFRVAVMGEVGRPSVVTVPSEKISLLEALALAGDLTIYARRDNVMVIREENGKRQIRRIDLTSSDLLTSPYYYLKSNDIVYAEANKARVASTNQIILWLPVIFAALSFGIIALDRY